MENNLGKLPPESKAELKVDVLIKRDFCSENCQFLIGKYDYCALFRVELHSHYITDNLYMCQRCRVCKEKIPSK